MDMLMPVMDGLKAIAYIRTLVHFRDLPIISLSAKAMTENRQEALDAGADRYMSNPVDRDELLHTIEALLLSKSHRQVLERTA